MGFPGLSLLCFFEWCDAQASIKNTRTRMIVMFIGLFTLLLLELSKSSSIEVTAQPIPGRIAKWLVNAQLLKTYSGSCRLWKYIKMALVNCKK